jgi:nicotinamidase-related amidase
MAVPSRSGPRPHDVVLVALHFQNDVLDPKGKIRAGLGRDEASHATLIRQARKLMEGVRARGLPVVSARIAFRPGHRGVIQNSPMLRAAVKAGALVEGSWGADFYPRLKPRRSEFVVTHSRINAFFGSDLEPVLTSLGAQRLLIAGVATHSAVEHTARHAADIGYHVAVAADACAAADAELHVSSLRALALHVDQVASVDEILASLDAGARAG